MSTDPHIIKAIVDMAVWLEFADESQLDPDAAVSLLEQLAGELQLMDDAARRELARQMSTLAGQYSGRERKFVTDLPEALGLIDA